MSMYISIIYIIKYKDLCIFFYKIIFGNVIFYFYFFSICMDIYVEFLYLLY